VEGPSALGYFLCGGAVQLSIKRSLLCSTFGDEAWQQPGFKVHLSVYKDGACIAG
jgi:hypothetical protein